jgi:uncharacterized membrane protein YeiH
MTDFVLKHNPRKFLLFADLAGIVLFGIEGATAAAHADLDFLGLMVLAFATALAGGIFRDLLIGAVPPASLRDWRYPATAFVGGAVVFFLHHFLKRIPAPIMIDLDAMALALFAVAGTEKALEYNLNPFIAALLGTVTAVGGGTVRDIFLAQVPRVLNVDIYATAAFLGAAVMVLCRKFKIPPGWSALLGGMSCFLLRLVSVWQHWNLPKVVNP